MAACRNGTGWRRRWVFTLSLVATLAVIAMGVFLWQAVELSSLMTVSQRVDQAKPLLGGLRLTLIGLLALLWPWLSRLRHGLDDGNRLKQAHWMALRWRIVGWLLVIELIIGQNLLGRVVGVLAHAV